MGALAIAMVAGSAHAQEREVSNTANVSWNEGGAQRSIPSNTVVTRIVNPTIAPTIGYFIASPQGGTPTQVGGGCGTPQDSLVNLVPTQTAAAGVPLYVVVRDEMSNRDASRRETVPFTITQNGSSVVIDLVETSADSGVFAGQVRTSVPGSSSQCVLPISGDGSLSGRYGNVTAGVGVSPFNVVFDSVTRQPVDGATVEIVDAASGAPAKVFGLDGVSTYPSSVVVGAAASDSAGRRYDVTKGGFSFPIVAPGTYRLVVKAADAHLFPSASSPEDFSDHPVVSGKTVNVTAGSYGKPFQVETGRFDVDVPLDPSDAGLVVTKSVSTDVATPGDYVQYKVTVENRSATSGVTRPVLTDVMPQGLRYQKGSLKIDGVKVPDPQVAADGATMTATLPILAAGRTYTLNYVALVTSNTPIGDAVNVASVRAGGVASNTAKAAVRIDGGLFSDAVTIIGRVVSDSCRATGPEAKPVPGVRILLEDGTYVVTDDDGQYHIENVRPGLHVAQMDRNSIPKGYHLTKCGDDTRRGGSGLSQFIDARGGALWRADFYLARDPGAQAPSSLVAPQLTPSPLTTPSIMGSATPLAGPTAIPVPQVQGVGALAVPAGSSAVPAAPDVVVTGQNATPAEQAEIDRQSVIAAGGGVKWIERATGSDTILFPALDHNPRAQAIRIVVDRAPKDAVTVTVNGIPVDPISMDSTVVNPAGTAAVDVWTGVPLRDGENVIAATFVKADGTKTTDVRRVSFTNTVDHAEIVQEKSRLVADGTGNPVIAIRVLDRAGKPVRAGSTGRLDVDAPYQTADAVQRRRESQLVAQANGSQTTWVVRGDDGIAYIELAPTTQTGEVRLNMHLRDTAQGLTKLADTGSVLDRRDEIRAWLSPGKQDWVVVGFAAGSAGYTTIARQAESLSQNPGDVDALDGQVKLYAKGRIKGSWLMTLAYDTDKKSDRQRRQSLLTTIDPQAYYTLYGDTAQQGYDAQSTKNVYVRLETKQFYALFGDFTTSIDDTELGQYQRTLTGLKGEYRSQKTAITAFVASTPFRHEKDEIQGQGLTGPYQLQRRDLVLNTERVQIQVRERANPSAVLSVRELVRYVDYDIDYARGTITLREPLLSRTPNLDPQFMVVDYETYGSSQERTVAGVRATRQIGKRLVVGGSAVQDDDDARTRMGTVDATLQVGRSTRVHAEGGYSGGDGRDGHAFIAEVQHRTDKVDARAYVREQTRQFGVGQTNAVDAGFRKVGGDAVVRVTDRIDVAASAYQLSDLTSDAMRRSFKVEGRARLDDRTQIGVNLQRVDEVAQSGLRTDVTQIGGSASRSFLDNRLQITGDAQVAFSGDPTVAAPSTYRIGASYAVSSAVRIIGEHQIARGSGVTGMNDRIGAEVTPWNGATLSSSWNKQAIGENGERTYGAFGAKQTFRLAKAWTADLALDSTRTLSGGVLADQVNPLNPTTLNRIDNGRVDGDYTSVSAGLAHQTLKTAWTGRVETRLGTDRRYGFNTTLVHQLSEGRIWGGSASAYRLNQFDGGKVDHADAAFSLALRQPTDRLQILDKLEAVYDRVLLGAGTPSPTTGISSVVASQNAILAMADGTTYGPIANTSTDASSLRFINNLAVNWIAAGTPERGNRTQVSFYYGAKYGIQNFDGQNYGGFTDMASIEARHDLTSWLDLGIQTGVRHSWSAHTMNWSLGPTIGISPIRNSWISVGYNVTGFEDRDFSGARSTVKGLWVALRMKFDEESLGLARRAR